MASLSLLLLLLVIGSTAATTSRVGVTYNPPAVPQAPQPEKVVAELQRLGISSVRISSADPSVICAFSDSNISILLTIPNSDIPVLAANRSNAAAWLHAHVVPFYPRALISVISVGSNVFEDNLLEFLLPAIRHVDVALQQLGIRLISVSTAFSFTSFLKSAFPPSSGEIREPADADGFNINNLLQFLQETNSSFLINLYPFDLYMTTPEIPLAFALFQEAPFNFRDDPVTGVRYRNLHDTMADAVITAIAVAGYENMPVVVAETGWPCSSPRLSEAIANQGYAEMFVRGLIKHINSGAGTQLRKVGPSQVYLYELFDTNNSEVRDFHYSDRSWGIMYPNMTSKFHIDFAGNSSIS